MKKVNIFSSLVAVLLIVFLVGLLFVDNVEIRQSRSDSGFTAITDYTCVEIEDEDAPIGVKKEYTFTLSDNFASDEHLAFYTIHQYVSVWLDGENIYSLKPSGMKQIIKTVGGNWTIIPIYRSDAGKEIRIEITPVYESFRDREVEFLLGSSLAIYINRLSKDLPQIILASMAVFMGLVFSCIGVCQLIRKHRGSELAALGLFSVVLGLWRLTDSRFSPFILQGKPVFLFYVSVTMLMIGMVPITRWVRGQAGKESCRVLDIYSIVSNLVCLIQLLLQFLGIMDLREMLAITHIMIGLGVVVVIGSIIYDNKKYAGEMKMPVATKLPFICLAGIMADAVTFYTKGNSSGLVFSLLAFLLYIMFMGIATMFNYSEQEMKLAEKDRQLAEQERKLTQVRITTMMSQIRTHFIFNVLTAISGFCKYDPEKADEVLILFSRYLRRNIRIIEEEELIDFSRELEQLEDYIALEQIRFPDMITFKKEIEEINFKIPPLTVQPIVENAIKHGLVEQGKSGTVRLHTIGDEKNIVIMVMDDGAGFDSEKCIGEDSVGIRNVRIRLEAMVQGSLTVESNPGKGTKVTICIPREKMDARVQGRDDRK